jgi:hypothetical protein
MIYIKDFGWRLGNQLFQIAAGYSLARQKQDQLIIPKWEYAKYFRGPFNISSEYGAQFEHAQQGFHYQPIQYTGRVNIGINGYFQSEKYFNTYADDIRAIFSMGNHPDVVDTVAANAEAMAGQGTTCSVHIRRGDYLNYPNHHPVLSADYYKRAMRQFHPDTVFWVFSDDIAWVKENIHAPNICYSHESDIVDFFSQSLCTHHIIANSTFSWWAAWLNPSKTKRVIAPSQWFGSALSHYNMGDLIPQGWSRI